MKLHCLSLLVLCSVLPGWNDDTDSPQATQSQQVTALEDSGELPRLDRSTEIRGPDANNNGVRDDIDVFLDHQPYSSSQLTAVKQLSKAIGAAMLVDLTNINALKASDVAIDKGVNCIYAKFPDIQTAGAASKLVEKITVNTKPRTLQYIKYQQAMNGKVLSSTSGDGCDN